MNNENFNEFDKNKEILTIEELREFEGFDNISDEEAEGVIDNLYDLTMILYEFEYLKSN